MACIVGSTAVTGDFMIVDASVQHEDRYLDEAWKVPGCVIIWGNDVPWNSRRAG